MLKQAIGSLAVALVFAGCGLAPEDEDPFNAMPSEAEVLEAQAAVSSEIASFAAGDQTRKETGIYTWKVNRNQKNVLFSGYNKNGKRIFRNWVWAAGQNGVSSLYLGHAAKITSFSRDQRLKVHVGSRMSPAKRKQQKQIADGLTRDFKKQGRFGCTLDALSCGVNTVICSETASTSACAAAAVECAAAWESCDVAEKLKELGEAIAESYNTLSEHCQDPNDCMGT